MAITRVKEKRMEEGAGEEPARHSGRSASPWAVAVYHRTVAVTLLKSLCFPKTIDYILYWYTGLRVPYTGPLYWYTGLRVCIRQP